MKNFLGDRGGSSSFWFEGERGAQSPGALVLPTCGAVHEENEWQLVVTRQGAIDGAAENSENLRCV